VLAQVLTRSSVGLSSQYSAAWVGSAVFVRVQVRGSKISSCFYPALIGFRVVTLPSKTIYVALSWLFACGLRVTPRFPPSFDLTASPNSLVQFHTSSISTFLSQVWVWAHQHFFVLKRTAPWSTIQYPELPTPWLQSDSPVSPSASLCLFALHNSACMTAHGTSQVVSCTMVLSLVASTFCFSMWIQLVCLYLFVRRLSLVDQLWSSASMCTTLGSNEIPRCFWGEVLLKESLSHSTWTGSRCRRRWNGDFRIDRCGAMTQSALAC
jgi:hypothetical protein